MLNVQAFYKSDLEPVSVWNKLTGKRYRKNAVIELNNLLSERPLLEISRADVQAILDRYELNLFRDFSDGSLRELYKKYLRYCFEDNHLDDEEIKRLRHLKRILGLSEPDVATINHQVCQEVYERALDDALEDHRLDAKELGFLKQLRQNLQLPASVATAIHQRKAQTLIIDFIKGTVDDKPLSSEEEEELRILIDHLNVSPQWEEKTWSELIKYRLFWQIENEALPPIFVPISLHSGEVCYFLCDATWHELADEHPSLSLPVPDTMQSKLADGTYWRNNRLGTIHLAENTWQATESGKLYLTNRHLVFRSAEMQMMIHLESILDFDHYRNGLLLYRRKNGPVFFTIPSGSNDVFAMMLGQVLREV